MGPRYAVLPSTIPVEPFSPPFHLTFHCFLFNSLSFIEELLSLCESQIYFNLSVYKVQFDWDECISPLLNFADKPLNLFFVKEELTGPQGIMIQAVRLGIGTDMGIDEEDLTPFDVSVTISQINLSVP